MKHASYHTTEYKNKLSELSRRAWARGVFNHRLAKIENRKCKRIGCEKPFASKEYAVKEFCSRNCAATHNNIVRGSRSIQTRERIGRSLRERQMEGFVSPRKGKIIVPRLIKSCLTCKKEFETPRWQNHKYCSVSCSIRDVGSRRTSPKAAKGKSGIREDIDSTICFYSRWEANLARIFILFGIQWKFQPKTFNLGAHKYTPDFYLPEYNVFIEVKNFLSEFSYQRDKKFRELYPDIALVLLLKDEYLKLQEQLASFIENWEYS